MSIPDRTHGQRPERAEELRSIMRNQQATPRGHGLSRLLRHYTRSLRRERCEGKTSELLPPLAADCAVVYRRWGSKDGKRGKKLSTETGEVHPSYIRNALSSRLAPIHFRNQLNLLYDIFPIFQAAVSESWRGLNVEELIQHGGEQGKSLFLQIRDGEFVGEISTMGHGVQMWLQTIWFLTRARQAGTLILDEPDVYLHADLQRKLIRSVRDMDSQVIITTHSTEIMSEVEPQQILVIDKRLNQSKRADSLPAVQTVLSKLGSAQNIHLFRLWSARRFLLVEGDDLRFLQGFQNILFPGSAVPIAALPNASFGGWGGWGYALGSSNALANAAGSQIATYCLLDSDYHCQAQIDQVYSEFARCSGQVYVWRKKEIENYILSAPAVTKAIVSRLPKRASPPSEVEVANKLNEFAASFTNELFDAVAQELLSTNRGLGAGGANKQARASIDARIQAEGLLSCVSGKAIVQKLFSWIQTEFGASLNTLTIIRNFTVDEIDSEMKGVLTAIENATPLPTRSASGY